MNTKINKLKKSLLDMQPKVVKVTKTDYTLDNGDVYEHTFDIYENITVEEFQSLLHNAKNIIVETLNKIENDGTLEYLHTFIKLFLEKWGC